MRKDSSAFAKTRRRDIILWDAPGRHPIWMAEMRFPLDLIWLRCEPHFRDLEPARLVVVHHTRHRAEDGQHNEQGGRQQAEWKWVHFRMPGRPAAFVPST
jgi:Uncharacterized ACR, COG1430